MPRCCRPWCYIILGMVLTSTAIANELATARYVRLDSTGKVLSGNSGHAVARCVEDRRTGLIWELKTTDGGLNDVQHTYAWYRVARDKAVARCGGAECNAPTYIAAVNAARLCGAADWRLPAREELRSIVDYARAYPGPTIDTAVFQPTAANYYWASNEDASDARNAWGIGFVFGFDYAYPKENAAHVRLVRRAGEARHTTFELLAEGTVRDNQHGLVWQRCSEGQSWDGTACAGNATQFTFAEAQSRPRAPWRLPTLLELARLVDTTRYATSINIATFPNTAPTSYWSDTPQAGRPGMMWLVNFMYGDNFVDATDERAAVRWVYNE